jgi:uncharacterized membrane protein YoaK (UPF0700 family)
VTSKDDVERALPAMLLTLTVVTGVVDAASYLSLGHVFVANMTGNVVFLGFALAGAPGLSVSSSLASLAAFLLGAVGGGRLGSVYGARPVRLLSLSTRVSTALVGVATLSAAFWIPISRTRVQLLLTVLLACAMGFQNATARRLGVPDATTTVLTLTLTGLAADSRLAGGAGPRTWRRVASVLLMLAGAFCGAMLVRHSGMPAVLSLALSLQVGVASWAWWLSRRTVG